MARNRTNGLLNVSPEIREDLTNLLCDWIDSAITEKDELADRWAKNRSQYNGEPLPFISTFLPQVSDKCYPFSGPLINTLNDNVHGAIFSQDPILSAVVRGTTKQEVGIEKLVQYFFEQGQLEEKLKSVGADSGTTNHGIIRSTVDPETMLFRFDAMPPDDLIVLGSGSYNIETSVMAGHSFYPTVGEVLERIAAGEYYEHPTDDGYEPNPVALVEGAGEDATSKVGGRNTDDLTQPTRIWCLEFKCDTSRLRDRIEKSGKRRVSTKKESYVAHVDRDRKHLLSLRKAPSKRAPYYSFGYIPVPTHGFWTKRSIGWDLQQPHDAYQIVNNTILYGSLLVAFRPILSRGPFAKYQTFGIATLVNTRGGEVTMPNISFDASHLQEQALMIERVGQATVRISQAGIAQASHTSKTATQVDKESMGEAIGNSGYVSVYSIPLCEMAREIVLYAHALWPQFVERHGEALGVERDPETGEFPMQWPYGDPTTIQFEVVGASPASNPSHMIATTKMLREIAANDPNFNVRKIDEALVSATGIRNSSEMLFTEQELAMQAQEAAAAKAQAAQAQQDAASTQSASEHMAAQAGLDGKPYPGNDGEQGMGALSALMSAAKGNSSFGV